MASTGSPEATAPTAHTAKTSLTDTIRETFASDATVVEKVKTLYKAKPLAVIALGAVAGIAVLNTLRGK